MTALTFTLKKDLLQRLDMSPVTCNALKDLAPGQVAEIKLQYGKSKIRISDAFEISGNDTQNIIIENSNAKLDFIGKNLTDGNMTVNGDAGAYLGLSMQSGKITVKGNTDIFSACEMKNGLIEITGNAGDLVAAALPGNKQGMAGGTVIIKGNAGERAGDHMRRGYLLIEGNAGDYCGSRMIAGTIGVMGQTGRNLGYAMRRGTLLLWHKPELMATFNDCGVHTLQFLPLLFKSFKQYNSKFADPARSFHRVQRYGGDMAEKGRGEILVRL